MENNCNVLATSCEEKILQAAQGIHNAGPWTAIYGDGHAGTTILNALGTIPPNEQRVIRAGFDN